MPTTLIVDGYNVIRRDAQLSRLERYGLETARQHLLQLLRSAGRLRQYAVIVVFDGWQGGQARETSQSFGQVRVIYSALGERADTVIVRLAHQVAGGALIVSDDLVLRGEARPSGASFGSVEELMRKVRPPAPVRPRDGDDEEPPPATMPGRRNKKKRRPPPSW